MSTMPYRCDPTFAGRVREVLAGAGLDVEPTETEHEGACGLAVSDGRSCVRLLMGPEEPGGKHWRLLLCFRDGLWLRMRTGRADRDLAQRVESILRQAPGSTLHALCEWLN